MASIHAFWRKSKSYWLTVKGRHGAAVFLVLTVLGSNLLAFGLGRLSLLSAREPVVIELTPSQSFSSGSAVNQSAASLLTTNKNIVKSGSVEVVASRQGSKYHFPWCSGAKRIKPENLVTFANTAAARAAGLTPAANCPGLE